MGSAGRSSHFAFGKENWESKIPLKITLTNTEISTLDAPLPLYCLGPRMGYLPSLVPLVLSFYRHVLPPGADTPWFEVEGLPLRWQVPIGVLYDLLAEHGQKPWQLTVHFRGFPASLQQFSGANSLRSAYLNSLKEAAYICTGSSAAAMGMATSVQEDLWNSVENSKFAPYFDISESMSLSSTREGRRGIIPLRVYMRKCRGQSSSYQDVYYTSRPMPGEREDASYPSLGDTLSCILPEYFESQSADNSNIGEMAAVSAGVASPTAVQAADEGQQWLVVGKGIGPKLQVDGKPVIVTVCGIHPRLDTPLAWLHSQLRHPDHFLYVVLHV